MTYTCALWMQTFTIELFAESNASEEWQWGIRIAKDKVVLEHGKAISRIAAQRFAQRAFEERVTRAGLDLGVPDKYFWREQFDAIAGGR